MKGAAIVKRLVVAAVLVSGGLGLLATPAHAIDPPLSGVTQVDAGDGHTCAVAARKAWCWGDDTAGQIGNGPSSPTSTAARVLAVSGSGQLSSVLQVTAGAQHSCARLANGQARCWGANDGGQLGTGNTTPSDRPVVVMNASGSSPLSGIRQIVAGARHTCAIVGGGQVRCWGANPGGQLGDGSTDGSPRPVTVRTRNGVLTGVSQISTTFSHTCARRTDGTVRCWGPNEVGRIGDGTTADRHRATQVLAVNGRGPLTDVVQVSAGFRHSCAVLANGQARCWGENSSRELGTSPTGPAQALRPVVVRSRNPGRPPLTGVRSISGGAQFTCAVLRTGQVRCWGIDDDGQSGDGTRTGRVGPVPVLSARGDPGIDPATPGNLTGITQVSTGLDHACVRRNDGRALCWGSNDLGQIGSGTGPVDVLRPTSVLAAS